MYGRFPFYTDAPIYLAGIRMAHGADDAGGLGVCVLAIAHKARAGPMAGCIGRSSRGLWMDEAAAVGA